MTALHDGKASAPATPAPARRSPWLHPGRIAIAVAVVALLVWAFQGIGFRGLGASWPQVLAAIGRGFAEPDWAYVYDGSGEDLLSALLVTVAIAFFGTVLAVFFAAPLAFLAARRPGIRRILLPGVTGVGLTVLRTFPDLILAVIFVVIVGPGPFAGALAIGVGSIGMLGRLFAEEIEKLPPGPDEALTAAGAARAHVLVYAQLPRLVPHFLSLALNRFEISVRSAAILGMVGAGGIGTPILFAVSSRSWDRVAIILLGVVVTITLIDAVSGALRRRLR
ncbi:phosphonate ABC transporter, permease protein PhnE [Microbacterium album]|uniref:Phosphonate ABC transporter permease n=1 Tax=Microbacterium album TaxID=2053191 RepID=A0A917IDB7_9MICO|nr:phosphonate ABC transporter, permease protein PhnE [Microbacterium album]GGH34455.1 phosphonate ABC transporter permease [Microbacterium album]